MNLDKSLKDFVQATLGSTDDNSFITRSKSNHKFAIEYAARLLRVTVTHHGPILHHHIHPELRRDAVSELGLSRAHRRLPLAAERPTLRLNGVRRGKRRPTSPPSMAARMEHARQPRCQVSNSCLGRARRLLRLHCTHS